MMAILRNLPVAAVIALLGLAPRSQGGEALPRDLGDWRISYGVSGGIAAQSRAVSLDRAGGLTVVDSFKGQSVRTHAGADLMALVTGYLPKARLAKPAKPRGADMMYVALTLTTGERWYELEPYEAVTKALEAAGEAAVASALVGPWRESQWKLCTPAAQLAMADVDPPIERLELHADNTYSVTWQGGGAHTGDIPHVFVPDYSGRYTARPSSGTIQFTYESGIVHPPDFSGSGTFSIVDDRLTIRKVWFGTRKAAHKPDICELTFVRP